METIIYTTVKSMSKEKVNWQKIQPLGHTKIRLIVANVERVRRFQV